MCYLPLHYNTYPLTTTNFPFPGQAVQEHVPEIGAVHVAGPDHGNILWNSGYSVGNTTLYKRLLVKDTLKYIVLFQEKGSVWLLRLILKRTSNKKDLK